MSSSLISIIYDIKQWYMFYSSIVVLTIGLSGNVCHILVSVNLRSFRGNQCAFMFIVESISNIGLFLVVFPWNLYSHITGIEPTLISLFWCKFLFVCPQTFGLCSLFTICFLTFDQFMSTNPRLTWRQISSLKLAHRFTFVNVCIVLLHSIPFFILTEIRLPNGCGVYNIGINFYYSYFYYPFLNSSLPITVTVTFSLLAYRHVRRIVRRQIPIVRRRLDRQLTAMTLTRVISLILLGLPYVISNLYRLNLRSREASELESAISNLVSSITFSLVYMNFAINFYLFLIVSARFRRQVKNLIVKKFWNFLTSLCHPGTLSGNRNQVAPETTHGVVSDAESV